MNDKHDMSWDDIEDPGPPRDRGRGGRSGGPGGGPPGPQFEMPPIKIPQLNPSAILVGVIILLVVWIVPGVFYTVAQDEVGVVTRFGEYVRTTQPGLHYKLPSPIEHVETPTIRKVRAATVGFRQRGSQEQDVPNESLMLTGDENIVDIDLVVQYHIINAKNYLFNVRNQPQAVHDVAETALRGIIGNRPIDDVLTTGKAEIQIQVKEAMQFLLDKYATGIQILNTQLKDVSPPKAVDFAFKDVQSAKEDKDRLINEAKGYRNSIIPEARGKSAQIVAAAEAYREEVINKAQGDAHRFLAQYKEYKKAPEVTKTRIYLETMEEIFPDMNKVIMPDSKNGVLPILPLNKSLNEALSSTSKK
ncbi:MAG: FtsH protease activity modulator HflK [Nitrospinota bacterium]|nr:FtsH protease activity modulator HflK [Nitrospinota bacterium]